MTKSNINNQYIQVKNSSVQLRIKREDLLHPFISGNKYRKLKYNIKKAKQIKSQTLLTFGGAFSNHIAAVAFAGKEYDFKTVGVIRGDELIFKKDLNSTLKFAQSCGMQFKFVTRTAYRNKMDINCIADLRKEFGDFYLIPEGGTNDLAIRGCEDILTKDDESFDYICCSVGTGGTISGLINSSKKHQYILGFPALKNEFLKEDICKFAIQNNWKFITDYHFGGYGKIKPELITFINKFKNDYNVPLDPIYTGKMMFGIFDLIDKGYFPIGSKILAIHTGGLQGIAGVNELLKRKNLPLIEL